MFFLRVFFIVGIVNDNVIKVLILVIEVCNLYFGVEVNGGFDKNEIFIWDINGMLKFKLVLFLKFFVGFKLF